MARFLRPSFYHLLFILSPFSAFAGMANDRNIGVGGPEEKPLVKFERCRKILATVNSKKGRSIIASAIATTASAAWLYDRTHGKPEEVPLEKILNTANPQQEGLKVEWPTEREDGRAFLKIAYALKCSEDSSFKYINAHLLLEDGTVVRTHLFARKSEVSISAGLLPKNGAKVARLYLDTENRKCELTALNPQPYSVLNSEMHSGDAINWDKVAELYAPRIVVRNDQYENPDNDILLQMKYVIKDTAPGEKTITYEAYMSEEDSLRTPKKVAGQNGVWGRTLDIERSVMIRFDSNGKPLGRRYQGFLHFDGNLDTTDQETTIHNVADNNIFAERTGYFSAGALRWVGRAYKGAYDTQWARVRKVVYAPALTGTIPYPIDRAEVSLLPGNEWMYEISDDEIRREGKLPNPATRNVYVILGGELKKGRVGVQLLTHDGIFYNGGHKELTVKRFGADAWGQEGVSAIPVPELTISRIREGKINLQTALRLDPSSDSSKNELSILRAYIIKNTPEGYKTEKVFGN